MDKQQAKNNLLSKIEKLNQKYELSKNIPENYFEPGMMENLDQYRGTFDDLSNTVILRTEIKGLRYEGRTRLLEDLSVGDEVQIVRDADNKFNPNDFMVNNANGKSLGNLPAELCNVLAPLYDEKFLRFDECTVTYIEQLRDRSRYAKQGVLFIQIEMFLSEHKLELIEEPINSQTPVHEEILTDISFKEAVNTQISVHEEIHIESSEETKPPKKTEEKPSKKDDKALIENICNENHDKSSKDLEPENQKQNINSSEQEPRLPHNTEGADNINNKEPEVVFSNRKKHIIDLPLKENFIVNGSAGSGKTMIMLQRVFDIARRDSQKINEIIIITPNKLNSSNDYNNIGLSNVDIMPLEEYYIKLINSVNNTDLSANRLASEKDLDRDYLTTIYSIEFQEKIRRVYTAYFNKVYHSLKEVGYISALKSLLKSDFKSAYNDQLYEKCVNDISHMRTIYSNSLERLKPIENDLSFGKICLRTLNVNIGNESKRYIEKSTEYLENANKNLVEKTAQCEQLQLNIDDAQHQVSILNSRNKFISHDIEMLSRNNEIINKIANNKQIYTFDYIRNNDDKLCVEIKNNYRKLFDSILEKERALLVSKGINFIKKSHLNREYKSLVEQFNIHIKDEVFEFLENNTSVNVNI